MDRSADEALLAFAEEHHGVFRGAHARLCGLSKHQIEGRIELGLWRRLYDDVYIAAGAPRTWKGALLAACWAGGFRAVVSHRSAAALWKLAGGRKTVVEITCPRWRRAQHAGLVVHESTRLDGSDLAVIEGIPVTTPERTLLDLGAVCHESVVEMALDKAENTGLVTRESVKATLDRLAKRGRRGAQALRQLHARHEQRRRPPESDPWRIAIEYDSDAHHSGTRASERDNARRLRIIRAKWFPVEATLPDLRSGGALLAAALQEARASFLRQQGTP
jgi:hypothetical protein